MSITITGLKPLLTDLQKMKDKVDPDKVAGEIANKIYNAMKEAFEEQQSPFGEKWSPLKPATIAKKERNKHKILWESGTLQQSTYQRREGYGVFVVGVNAKAKNSDFQYGIAHQWGTKYTPQRAFMPVRKSGKLAPRVQQEVATYLSNLLSKI